MGFICRAGTKDDLSVILQFLEKRTIFPRYIGFESPDIVRKVVARTFKAQKIVFEHPDVCPVFIAQDDETDRVLGYMFLVGGVEESITEDKQTLIYDYFVDDVEDATEIMDHFLAQAEMWTEEAGYRYITTEIRTTQKEAEEYFASRGFVVEMNRIVKKVSTFTFDTPRQRKFRVRPAEERDRMFILLLNAENSKFLIPVGRDVSEDYVKESYFDTYTNLNITSNPYLKVFVAEDIEKHKSAGYIMIKTQAIDAVSARQLAYIFDISVHKDYWGAYVGQRLVKEAQNWLATVGVEYLIGDTADNNPRPLMTALRTLDFDLYSKRWVKKLG